MHLTTDVVTIGGPVAGAVVLIVLLLRKLIVFVRRFGHFLDDWFGQPARPGVPEQAGVMTRLANVEAQVERVEGQLKPNGGNSIYDKVTRVDSHLSPDTP